MNHIIKSQLSKCTVAQLPSYDDYTTQINIPKGSAVKVSTYQVHKYYVVELSDWMLYPPNDATLVSNWNKNTVPKSRFYKCEISQVIGKMVRITGCGYDPERDLDTNDIWEGWVPQSEMRLIRELV